MDLDASKKAQLIVFIEALIGKSITKFPPGYIAHMSVRGQYATYVYTGDRWHIVSSV